MQLEKFCTNTEIFSNLKRPPTECEKIFASCISEKGPRTRIYNLLKKFNSPNSNDLIKKWAMELSRTFSKEVQAANIHMKKCSLSLAIK
jgi:hypothetical protein